MTTVKQQKQTTPQLSSDVGYNIAKVGRGVPNLLSDSRPHQISH